MFFLIRFIHTNQLQKKKLLTKALQIKTYLQYLIYKRNAYIRLHYQWEFSTTYMQLAWTHKYIKKHYSQKS